ncbi:MAG: cytochrome c [Pseudomonadales bacterium]|nr:cytochrome c [Pseudomonadales bacterium]
MNKLKFMLRVGFCMVGASIVLSAIASDDLTSDEEARVVLGAGKQLYYDHGKQLYYDHGCFACHGYNGIGKHNLANDVSAIMTSDAVYLAFIRARSELNPPLPSQKMPHYPASSLSDQQALDIYAYIKTFKDTPPKVDDAPALKAIIEAAQQ